MLEKCPPQEYRKYSGYPKDYITEHIRLCEEYDERKRKILEPLVDERGWIEWTEEARQEVIALTTAFARFEVDLLIKYNLLRGRRPSPITQVQSFIQRILHPGRF